MEDVMEYQRTPREEIQSRIARFQKSLQDSDITGALISQNVDLFYFAGTIQRSFLFIPAEVEAVLAVHGNLERAQKESSLSQVVPLKKSQQLAQALYDFNYSIRDRIRLEMDDIQTRYSRTLPRGRDDADCLEIRARVITV